MSKLGSSFSTSLAQQPAVRLRWLPWLLASVCLLDFGVVTWQYPGFDNEVTSNISFIEPPMTLLLFRQAGRQGPLQDWVRSRH